MELKGTERDWEQFSKDWNHNGAEHTKGDLDCPVCYVAKPHECGGVLHSVEVMLYPESEDAGYINCCDTCFQYWEL